MIFLEVTSQTWIITLVGWVIVFLALVLLILVFNTIPKLLNAKKSKALKAEGKLPAEASNGKVLTGDENAAISVALYLFLNEMHDEESNVITIKPTERRYSPWSSKIYGVTQNSLPNR